MAGRLLKAVAKIADSVGIKWGENYLKALEATKTLAHEGGRGEVRATVGTQAAQARIAHGERALAELGPEARKGAEYSASRAGKPVTRSHHLANAYEKIAAGGQHTVDAAARALEKIDPILRASRTNAQIATAVGVPTGTVLVADPLVRATTDSSSTLDLASKGLVEGSKLAGAAILPGADPGVAKGRSTEPERLAPTTGGPGI